MTLAQKEEIDRWAFLFESFSIAWLARTDLRMPACNVAIENFILLHQTTHEILKRS